MKKTATFWIACAALAASPAMAQKDCSKADSATAEKAVDRVVNPTGLYKAFKDHGHCDKPPVEDIFTDAVLRLMVEWKDVDTLAADAQRDAAYKAFLFKHVKSPAAKEDRESIFSRAKSNCPMTQGPFCAEVMEVAKGGGAPKDDLLAPLPTIPAAKK
jgi:hypothetical protein